MMFSVAAEENFGADPAKGSLKEIVQHQNKCEECH